MNAKIGRVNILIYGFSSTKRNTPAWFLLFRGAGGNDDTWDGTGGRSMVFKALAKKKGSGTQDLDDFKN